MAHAVKKSELVVDNVAGLEGIIVRDRPHSQYVEITLRPLNPSGALSYDLKGLADLIEGLTVTLEAASQMHTENGYDQYPEDSE